MIDHRVYLVTDDPSRYSGDWLDNIEAAIRGGVTCVQYRDTESDETGCRARALKLQEMLRECHIPLIINNNAQLAADIGAEGVHVGQDDMPPEEVRKIVGPECEIGLSLTSIADVEKIAANVEKYRAVDAFGIGPVYDARKTKVDAADAMGPDGFAEIGRRLDEIEGMRDKPRVAIGGITVENAAAIVNAGAQGLAIVSAFSKSENPNGNARSFSMLFDNRRV